MSKYIWVACMAVALTLGGIGIQEAKAQHGHGGHRQHGHHGHHGGNGGYGAGYGGYRTGYGGYGANCGVLPVYGAGYGSYYGVGNAGLNISRNSFYSSGVFPGTLGPYGGLGGYGNYGYLSHQPAAPRVQLRIGF
jgi:hypothetical protein